VANTDDRSFHCYKYIMRSDNSTITNVLSLTTTVAFVQSFTSSTYASVQLQLRIPSPQLVRTIAKFTSVTGATNQVRVQLIGTSTGRSSFTLMASLTDAWDAYNHSLELHPLIVKSITASIILGLGDFAGQAVQSIQTGSDSDTASDTSTTALSKGVDYSRAARFAIFGLILQAPWNHYYYLLLDGQIPPTVDEPFSFTNIMKVGIDQFIQAPIFTVLIFVFLGALEGKTLDEIKRQLQKDYPETIVANCTSPRLLI
jgi:peroxisomal membrane protein 2